MSLADPSPAVPAPVRSALFRGVGGVDVRAHDFGGHGQPLIIAHAAGFCGGAYALLAGQLRDRFHVWALDLRGHGDSAVPPDRNFSWQAMAHDVVAVATGLDLGPAVLFGHSLGGAAGLRAEALSPGTFTSIYVYEPAVMPDAESVTGVSTEMSEMVRQRRAVFASRAEAVARLSSRPPYDTMCAGALDAFVHHGTRITGAGVELKCTPESEALTYESPDKITVADVASVRVPVLLGVGGRDDALPARTVPRILAAMPNAQLARYENLGHMGPHEDPVSVAADAARHFWGQPLIRVQPPPDHG